MYADSNRDAGPNNIQLIAYYQSVCYLLRIQQYPVNTTYNTAMATARLGTVDLPIQSGQSNKGIRPLNHPGSPQFFDVS